MKDNQVLTSPFLRAKKRVEVLKNFYKHLTTYIVINVVLLVFSGKIRFILFSKEALGNPELLEWINWNIYGTPIVWGIALLIHAVCVFVPSPFKKWEERQIQNFIDKDKVER